MDAALFTIFSINGERCTAGSRVFVQRSIYDRFAREFAERAARLIVGDPRDPDTNVGSMITRQHWEKVTGYIEIGRREGAVVAAAAACRGCRRAWPRATSCSPPCSPAWTTACAWRRKRSSVRWSA